MTFFMLTIESNENNNNPHWLPEIDIPESKQDTDSINTQTNETERIDMFELLDERFSYLFQKKQDHFVMGTEIFPEVYDINSDTNFLTIKDSKSLNKLFPKQKLRSVGQQLKFEDGIYIETEDQDIIPGILYFGNGFLVYPVLKNQVICYNYYSIFGTKSVHQSLSKSTKIGQQIGEVLSINCTFNGNDIMFFDFKITTPLNEHTISILFKQIIILLQESYVDQTKPFTLILPDYPIFSLNIFLLEIYALSTLTTFQNIWNAINRIVLLCLSIIAAYQNKEMAILLFAYVVFKYIQTEF